MNQIQKAVREEPFIDGVLCVGAKAKEVRVSGKLIFSAQHKLLWTLNESNPTVSPPYNQSTTIFGVFEPLDALLDIMRQPLDEREGKLIYRTPDSQEKELCLKILAYYSPGKLEIAEV